MYRKLFVVAATVVVASGMVGITNVSAASTHGSGDLGKVTICHRTDAVNNPYVKETVSVNAVNGGGHDDHTSHTGPVASSLQVATNLKNNHIKWGDIIPAYGSYGGYNIANGGQAVLDNGCRYPVQVASMVASSHPTTPEVAQTSAPHGPTSATTPSVPAVLASTSTTAQLPTSLPETGTNTARVIAVALSLAATTYTVASMIVKKTTLKQF